LSPSVSPPVRLLSVATAVPEYAIDQEVAAEHARGIFGPRMRDFERLSRVFVTTAIERRYSVRPLDWFEAPHGWADRTEAYVEGVCALFARVVPDALSGAGLRAEQVDAVVFVSSTGVSTPSIEARLLPEMGFRADAIRVPVFGLGCAGGVAGLALASRLARGGLTVLLVAIELCTLAFRLDRATKADIIATSLFGDGAAAAVVSGDAALAAADDLGVRIEGATEHLWPQTLDIMGWSVDEVGLGVTLSRSLPSFIAHEYEPAFDEALVRLGLDRDAVDRVVCHPGGTRVLEAIETALRLPHGALDHERAVIRDFGNMSSPTVLFVLERALAAGLPPRTLLAALGPGFTGSFVSLAAGARA
jgi:alkylresorcinol/alkylpyrone synthase